MGQPEAERHTLGGQLGPRCAGLFSALGVKVGSRVRPFPWPWVSRAGPPRTVLPLLRVGWRSQWEAQWQDYLGEPEAHRTTRKVVASFCVDGVPPHTAWGSLVLL